MYKDMDEIDRLVTRINQNLADYHDHIKTFGKQEIIDMACHINAMNDAHYYLTEHHAFDYEQAGYLLQFENPLEIVADKWETRISDVSDMSFDLDAVFDKKDAIHDYPLVGAEAPEERSPLLSPYLQKFPGVDVLAALKAIANQKVVHYPNDIKSDMALIPKLAAKGGLEKQTLLWHVSDYGTHIVPERDAFVTGTGQWETWTEYLRPGMLSYAVEITGMENGKVMGNVYELNHEAHVSHVREASLPATTVTITYDDGRDLTVSRSRFDKERAQLMAGNGNAVGVRFCPEDESLLNDRLRREQRQREATPDGDLKAHVKQMADARINGEAERVIAAFGELKEPNSPNKTHFAVKLSDEFMQLSGTQEQERLFKALPYKGRALTGMNGQKGVFVTVPKNELQKGKPSLLGKLDAAKQKAAAQARQPGKENAQKADRGER